MLKIIASISVFRHFIMRAFIVYITDPLINKLNKIPDIGRNTGEKQTF